MKPIHLTTALIVLLSVASTVRGQSILPPDESVTVGKRAPESWFLDENGDTLRLRDLSGSPLVVSPVFTSCPHACPAITSSLVSALSGVGGAGQSFNVLTLSFDPNDTAEDLRAYREHTGMPAQWLLANGSPDQIEPFLEALDFQYDPVPGGGFAHANVVAVLSPGLTVSGYLHGLMYTEDEVKTALRAAAPSRPLVERARPLILLAALLALVAVILAIRLTARPTSAAGGGDGVQGAVERGKTVD